MGRRFALLSLLLGCAASAVIIDRIAVVVGDSIVKDSDIERDLRVTSFQNNVPLDLSPSARKKAASRLIDQVFIRREIQIGDYPVATLENADSQLEALKKDRFRTEAAYLAALRRYGLTDLELRTYLQWQLTVLRFIEMRFKPAVLVTDDDIEKYYRDHLAALRRENPRAYSLDDLRDKIRETLQAERTNQQFFAWLDDQRKETKIQYLEGSLA